MFNPERRAVRKAERERKREEGRAAFAAKHPERAAAWEAAKAARQQSKDHTRGLKDYVAANRAIASYNGVHVYPDRIIRLPNLAGGMFIEPESRPIAGVSATVEETGAVSSRSTLTRSMAPGLHGWQKKTDDRKGFVVVDGPDFQWQVSYSPQMDLGGARKFAAAVTTAGRQAAPRPAGTAQPMDPADQLRKLAELRDGGIVTQEEFEAKKAQLLAQM
ncbi:MAG: SHOCT domain-containing protein [Actinobacteria bacterium]|nr:SHOCT domain-containing protein [Actinomycetota bacterium]